jgi:NADPH-dependent ferric siderophore reductase
MPIARPSYSLFRVTAERVELVTPHVKRITIDGSCLPPFRAGLPAQWLKVFVPTGDGQAIPGRAYTVRRFDPVSKKLDLAFLHGDNGPVSAWAARVKPGESFEISATHPRSGFAIQNATEHYLLFGDETALPAIGGILEALPAHARADVFVEIDDAGEEQIIETAATVHLTWLHRKADGHAVARSLVEAAKALGRPDENTVVWIAAEASIVKSLRTHALLGWGVDRKRLHAAGYWKRGESNHKDEESD